MGNSRKSHGKHHIHGKSNCDQCKGSLIQPPSPFPHQVHDTSFMKTQDSVSPQAPLQAELVSAVGMGIGKGGLTTAVLQPRKSCFVGTCPKATITVL